jgi:hypothetical protein
MNYVINQCPICQGDLQVTELECKSCHTKLTGEFELSKFNHLGKENLYFIEVFMKNRGNIKMVEKELGISYPTVKKTLDEVIKALGYSIEPEEEVSEEISQINPTDILKQLADGDIDATTAYALLKKGALK